MEENFVVPDAIEPLLGYKALAIRDGHLWSPSYDTPWPQRKPLRSECRATSATTRFVWRLTEAPAGWHDFFWIPASVLTLNGNTQFNLPTEDPPEGMTWIPELAAHDLESCSCGIYVVSEVQGTASYLRGFERVLAKIALWGQVVPGSQGARGQFAYPQQLWAGEQQRELVEPVAMAYGVHLTLVRFHGPGVSLEEDK